MAKRFTTRDIPHLWASGRTGRASNLWTDGIDLYSYGMRIGTTVNDRKVLGNYTASGRYTSHTTSKHVGMGTQYANDVLHPTFFEITFGKKFRP